jgi:U3 small nucleolar RNA-associated protein 6
MAEQVQAVLDGMVAPLRDLLERNIFSEQEIQAIVARRRESEYLLRRRAVRKADYLRYLEKELQLEKLRELRSSRKTKKSDAIGDKHIVQHIHFIFTRLLRKYKSDIALYLQYIDFCKSTQSLKTLSKIYAQALSFHSRNPGLWIAAASHEFFQQASVANARVLLQRGIRVNPSCSELWLQYFSLELHHVQKLKGRREILRLPQQPNENPLHICAVVYQHAIQAIPQDVVFRLQCLDACNLFPSTQTLQAQIVETIACDFHHNVQAWMARAAFCNANNESQPSATGFLATSECQDKQQNVKRQKLDSTTTTGNPVVAVLEQAVEACPTAEMYLASIQFLQSSQDSEYPLAIHKLLIQAKDKEISSPALTSVEADILVQEGKLEAAMDTLEQACLQKDDETKDVRLWLQWARLCGLSNDANSTPPSHVLTMALERTPLTNGKEQMMILLQLFGALLKEATSTNNSSNNIMLQLEKLMERMLLLSAGANHTAPFSDQSDDNEQSVFEIHVRTVADACLQYLLFSISSRGINAARKVYGQVLFRSNYGGSGQHKTVAELETMKEFVNECIQVELNNCDDDKKKKKQRLGRLYNAAIQLFEESNPSLADSYRSQRDAHVRFASK